MLYVRAFVALAACSLIAGPSLAAEPAAVAHHVKTYLYFGAANINRELPATYVAAHADFIETTTTYPNLADSFKQAGGRYVVMYTDPMYVPYCVPPFTPPAGPCAGPIGNTKGLPESAWLHGPDGGRLNRPDEYTHQYQEILDPASPAARAAFRAYTVDAAAHARVDFFFADDTGAPFRGPDGTPMSGRFYRYNAAATELRSDQDWQSAMSGLFTAAVRPLIINGAEHNLQPAYNGAFLQDPNVAGENLEGCFLFYSPQRPLSDERWTQTEDGLLDVTKLHRYAVCMMQGKLLADPLARLYALASWWLTYDPDWSVIAPVDVGSDGYAVFSEEEIVPTGPLRSASSSVSELRVSGNAYVREFARCYENGRPIGPCAAVVNPSGSTTISMPRLSQHYTASLSLSSKSDYGGGTNTWSRNVPQTLGPTQGAILRE
jgi:hypothetical protein